jgi:hypothetical protein
MSKAILHIGTMKTGTTSIQTALAKNPKALASRGYTYCGPPMRRSEPLAGVLAGLTDENLQNLIISDEGLWHFSDSARSDTAGLAKVLKGYDVTVVIYLRRPDSFFESWFLQGLKSGSGSKTMAQFLASSFVNYGAQFQKIIKRFEALFGVNSVVIRPYEAQQLKGGDVVLDFLHTVGFPADEFDMPARSNETSNTDINLLLSMLRNVKLPPEVQTTQLQQIEKHLKDNGYTGRRYSLFTQAELKAIVDTYLPVFRELQAKYDCGTSPDFFTSWPDSSCVDEALLDLRFAQEALLRNT